MKETRFSDFTLWKVLKNTYLDFFLTVEIVFVFLTWLIHIHTLFKNDASVVVWLGNLAKTVFA